MLRSSRQLLLPFLLSQKIRLSRRRRVHLQLVCLPQVEPPLDSLGALADVLHRPSPVYIDSISISPEVLLGLLVPLPAAAFFFFPRARPNRARRSADSLLPARLSGLDPDALLVPGFRYDLGYMTGGPLPLLDHVGHFCAGTLSDAPKRSCSENSPPQGAQRTSFRPF